MKFKPNQEKTALRQKKSISLQTVATLKTQY